MTTMINEPLQSAKFYTGNSVTQRDWVHIVRYLVKDYEVTAGWHPSTPGTILSTPAGFVCKYTVLSSGVVYFDAYGDSPVWNYVALLDAVLLGEREMRKGQ